MYKSFDSNFPQYENELQSIIDRMVDLKIPFSKKWIDIPACQGSASIKNVLPVFIPALSYEELDIQEGMTASFVYSQLAFQDEETQLIHRNPIGGILQIRHICYGENFRKNVFIDLKI